MWSSCGGSETAFAPSPVNRGGEITLAAERTQDLSGTCAISSPLGVRGFESHPPHSIFKDSRLARARNSLKTVWILIPSWVRSIFSTSFPFILKELEGLGNARARALIIICVSFLFGFSGNLSSNVYSLFITSYDPVYRGGPL